MENINYSHDDIDIPMNNIDTEKHTLHCKFLSILLGNTSEWNRHY